MIWGEPTSFLNLIYLGCSQRECQTSKDIVDDYRNMFESRISAGALGKIPSAGERNAWKDTANWRTKQLNSKTKPQHHALTTTNSRKEKMGSVGELSKVCTQMVLNCLYLARIGRPDN